MDIIIREIEEKDYLDVLSIGNNGYTKGGIPDSLDVPPYIEPSTDRTMVPIRFIAEAFGASVNWQDDIKTDFIHFDDRTLNIVLNQPLPDNMGTAVIVEDRLFVPVRYVSEQLGATVEWDASTRRVIITK